MVEFLHFVLDKFGSLKNGWREFSDNFEKEAIDFIGFCRGVRKIGMKTSLKPLWDSIGDCSSKMSMTLEDWDPSSDGMYKLFLENLKDSSGGKDFEHCWKEKFGSTLSVSAYDFCQWITEGGYFTMDDAERIAMWLDAHGDIQERQFLTLEEIHAETAKNIVVAQAD